MRTALETTFHWTTMVAIIVLIILSSALVLLNSWVIQFVYFVAQVPADEHGLSLQDRTYYANLILEYFNNHISENNLSEISLPSDFVAPLSICQNSLICNSAFNDREIQHLKDVKTVLNNSSMFWIFALIIVIALFAVSWKRNRMMAYIIAIHHGSIFTLLLISATALIASFSFYLVFDTVHMALFSGDSWIFSQSDTLIRLFPEEFWRGAMGLLIAIAIASCLALISITQLVRTIWKNRIGRLKS